MLYEIRKQSGPAPFLLFVQKKNGLKFKKAFRAEWQVKWFVENYMRQCCPNCKQRGWVYKTQFPKPFRSNLAGSKKRSPIVGTITVCPECRMQYAVESENVQFLHEGKVYSHACMILTQICD